MVKSDIIKVLATQRYFDKNDQRLTQNQIKVLVDVLFEFLATSLSNGRRVEVRGFGCFSLKQRAANLLIPNL